MTGVTNPNIIKPKKKKILLSEIQTQYPPQTFLMPPQIPEPHIKPSKKFPTDNQFQPKHLIDQKKKKKVTAHLKALVVARHHSIYSSPEVRSVMNF
jgi:hypothetical protein